MVERFLIAAALGSLAASCATPERPAAHPIASSSAAAPDLGPVWAGVPALMERHRLPGLSVAVFDGFGQVEARAFGVKRRDGEDPVTKNTAFSTASISKPVTALLCLVLDAEGVIDIDAPIAPDLGTWQLPASHFVGSDAVTWRQLLTHTAGTSQHGFADYYEGDALPSLVDSLEGRIPRYDGPIAFLFAPGTDWQYSGGGYVIVQLALEERLGRPLQELAAARIFGPLGMTRTTMVQPGEAEFPADVASVHDADGSLIGTGLPITPQISASGMWSTPGDLARFAIAIQRALQGETVGPVTPEIARTMTDVLSLEHVGGTGTPFFRGFGFGNTDWFRHDGSNTGVNADLLASMDGGYGIVLMGNGDDDNTGPVFAELRRTIMDGAGWTARHRLLPVPLDPAMRDAVVGTYKGLLYDLGLEYRIESGEAGLRIVSDFFTQFLGRESSVLHYLGNGEFAIEDYPNRLRFVFDSAGHVEAVALFRPSGNTPEFVRPIARLR